MAVSSETIIVPRRREDFFDSKGEPTLRFTRWIELVTEVTNVAVVDIDDSKQDITSSSSRVSRNAARINSLELKEFEVIITTTSVTSENFQIIICKNTVSINITLDPEAIEGDELHVKRAGAVVEVIGQVDGLTNLTINVPLFSLHLVFNGTDWSQI